jgi:predicted MFS family arabinose efflux permease
MTSNDATTFTRESASYNPWWSVFGSFTALAVSGAGVMAAAFSIFTLPLAKEFGWSRSDISLSYSIMIFVAGIGFLPVGWLEDRYGVKQVTLISIVGFAASFAALSLMSSLSTFYFISVIIGCFYPGQSAMSYAKIVCGWFDKNRGLALGIVMAGTGLSAALIPLYARYLIGSYGWRSAYLGFGLAILVIAGLGVAVFVRNPPNSEEGKSVQDTTLPGLSLREAARTYSFCAIGISMFCFTAVFFGITAHLVLILTDRGITAGDAAGLLFWLGVGGTLGRLGSGIVFDHFHAPFVAAFVFAIALLGVSILLSGVGGWGPFVAVVCLGFSVGGETDALGYLTGCYFGLKRYGAIYGTFAFVNSIGASLGSFIMGKAFDTGHSFDTGLRIFIPGMLISIGLMLSIGPYRYAPRKH